MRKKVMALIAASILAMVLLVVFANSIPIGEDPCEDADYIFDYYPNINVACRQFSTFNTSDSRVINVSGGYYGVYVRSYRGGQRVNGSDSCQGQMNESFFITINGTNSIISFDNPLLGKCDYEYKDEYMGIFPFYGENNLTRVFMNHAALCPGTSKNESVAIDRICLFKEEPPCEDEDGDGVCDEDDECEDSLPGELVNEEGCDPFQFCKPFYCNPDCFHADFIPIGSQAENSTYPNDCTVVIIANEGTHEPRCTPTTCAN